MAAVSAAIVFSFLLEHIVFIQYTITAKCDGGDCGISVLHGEGRAE